MVDSGRMDYGEATATLDLAKQVDITNDLWERFRSDGDFRRRVSDFMRIGACAPPRRGPLPMYFGPLEWETFFSVKLTDEQWTAAGKSPWSPDLANQPCPAWRGTAKIGLTHFAFFGIDGITKDMSPNILPGPLDFLPMTVEGLIQLTSDSRYARWQNRPRIVNNLERGQGAPTEQLEMRWYCVPMSRPVVQTVINSPAEETPMGYEVATMVEYLAAKIFHYLLYTGHYKRYGEREYAPYAVCGAPARQEGHSNLVVAQGQQDGLSVGYTSLHSGGHEWFTALARKPE